MHRSMSIHVVSWLAVVLLGSATSFVSAAEIEIAPLVKTVNAIGPKGTGHRAAIAAWQKLAQADVAQLTDILAGIDENNPLAVNWLRAAADAVAQRELDAGGSLPQAALEKFLADERHAPKARRAAFEWLLVVDANASQRLIPQRLNDSSMELRRDAVADALVKAAKLRASGPPADAIAAFRMALDAARDVDQINEASKHLRELGQQVDLPTHFGFVMSWKLIGPFDNVGDKGFDVAYGPEVNLDPQAEYPGKDGEVKWIEHTTKDEYGTVDLNEALGKHKGAIAYAYAEFIADQDREVELRIGCINGNKVWVNGELVTANHVYHANTFIDQYAGRAKMKPGKNTILVKIAQNEQTESWAQRWQFQLRVCDRLGTAVLSKDRARTASATRLQSGGVRVIR